jgi:ribose-phosphate pyrophosphokinase
MELTIFSGSAHPRLAEGIARELGLELGERELGRFPDGELRVEIGGSVRGHDVYLLQPTFPAPETAILELLLLADACRRAGAARVTAVVPYFAYARQDRRSRGREPVGARLVADLLATAEIDHAVVVDVHTPAVEGFFSIPLEHLTAVPLLAEALRPRLAPDSVIVAPDLGAAKLASRYARRLGLPVAIVHKTRVSGSEVSVRSLTGEVRGRAPVLVDDMISTGATLAAAVDSLLEQGCRPEVTVAVSHALLVGPAAERLTALPIREILATDTVATPDDTGLPTTTASVAPLLADSIRRLHGGHSMEGLIVHV